MTKRCYYASALTKGCNNDWSRATTIGPVNPLTVLVPFNSVGVDDKLTRERMNSGGPMPSDLNANTIYHTECMSTRLKDIIHTNS